MLADGSCTPRSQRETGMADELSCLPNSDWLMPMRRRRAMIRDAHSTFLVLRLSCRIQRESLADGFVVTQRTKGVKVRLVVGLKPVCAFYFVCIFFFCVLI